MPKRFHLLLFAALLLAFLLGACTTRTAQSTPTAPQITAATTTAPAASAASPSSPTPASDPAASAELTGAELLAALRSGGYVLYFRHAATDSATQDAASIVIGDCATQRVLSPAGEEQARAIGRALQELHIPLGRVLAGPFCRTRETAQLAFGQTEIEPALENPETAQDEAERAERTAELRGLLSTPPAAGTNTVLVGHVSNLSAAARVTISEGSAAIFRPDGSGGFTYITTMAWDEWDKLE